MNTQILNPCCTAPRPRTLPLLGAILARIRQERRVARDTRRLAELSDDLLRDIGINRGDIPLAVRYGRDRDIEFARFR